MNHWTGSKRPAPSHQQRGVTLIEVLITVVIMAIGLLGLAGLQTLSIKANRTALQRSHATMHAHDILDCMRANRNAAVTSPFSYDILTTAGTPTSEDTIADQDLKRWREALAADLPNGSGGIAVDGATGVATIEIQWEESIEEGDPVTQTFTIESSL